MNPYSGYSNLKQFFGFLSSLRRVVTWRLLGCLLQAGAASNFRDIVTHHTALALASARGHMDVARLLLEAGSDKDCQGQGGKTALMLASESGHFEVARLLLEDGAKKECLDDFGWTALMLASYYGHLEVAHLLLHTGAPTDRSD